MDVRTAERATVPDLPVLRLQGHMRQDRTSRRRASELTTSQCRVAALIATLWPSTRT